MTEQQAQRRPTRTPLRDVVQLQHFLAPRKDDVKQIFVIRTSGSNKAEFEAMFNAGVALKPDDPDVQELTAVGHRIVLDEGASERHRLGAMELRRASVPGGAGTALLGWLVPIGRTLFVLCLSTARKADMAGATPDQSKNLFTEALCEIVRSVPKGCEIYAPLMSRLVRNIDFATQLLRTLAERKAIVWAEGKRVPLDGNLVTLIESWYAASEADATVARLSGIEAGIYSDGEWYQTSKFLPFTWRARHVSGIHPISGESETYTPDPRALEVVPGSVDVFDEFVAMLANPAFDLKPIGVKLGELGVRARDPRNFLKARLLSELNRPGMAVTSLISDTWLGAWRTGKYRKQIKLKADLSLTHPGLANRISEREDGTVYLDVSIDLPMPERGYWLTEQQYDQIMAVRKGSTPQRIGRAAATWGVRRPLASLSQWDEDMAGKQHRLATFDSSDSYVCVWRPLETAHDAQGRSLGWNREHQGNKLAVVRAVDLHASIAEKLVALDEALEGKISSLTVTACATPTTTPAQRKLASAHENLTRLQARWKGIRQLHQQALGSGDTDEVELLRAEQMETKTDVATATADLESAKRDAADEIPRISPEVVADEQAANLSSLSLIAVALERSGAKGPAALNDALHRLFTDTLRVIPDPDGIAVTWTGTVTVPLSDGTLGRVEIGSSKPIPGTPFKNRREGATQPDWPAVLAVQFFDKGLDFHQIGQLRKLDGSGKGETHLFKMLREWLRERGVTNPYLSAAAIDAPPEVRQTLHRMLDAPTSCSNYERHLREVYTKPGNQHWTFTWAASTHHDARLLLAAVEAIDPKGAPILDVYAHSDLPLGVANGLSQAHLATRARITPASKHDGPVADPVVQRVGTWAVGKPTPKRCLAARICPHRDCVEIARSGKAGVLIQLLVPELNAANGMICRACLRMPHDEHIVFPALYREEWVGGGRRLKAVIDGDVRFIGSHIAGTVPVEHETAKPAHNKGARKMNEPQQRRARLMLDAGQSIRSTAKELDVAVMTLTRTLNYSAGRAMQRDDVTPEIVKKLRTSGMTTKQIATELGCSTPTVADREKRS